MNLKSFLITVLITKENYRYRESFKGLSETYDLAVDADDWL